MEGRAMASTRDKRGCNQNDRGCNQNDGGATDDRGCNQNDRGCNQNDGGATDDSGQEVQPMVGARAHVPQTADRAEGVEAKGVVDDREQKVY